MLPTQAAAKEACRSSSKRMHRRFQIRSGPRKAGETGSANLDQARVPAAAQGLNQESAPGNITTRGAECSALLTSHSPSLPLSIPRALKTTSHRATGGCTHCCTHYGGFGTKQIWKCDC